MVFSLTFQLMAAAGAVGRVMTRDYVVSRSFNALALGAVAADFAVRYAFYAPASAEGLGGFPLWGRATSLEYSQAPQAAYMVGLLIFTILTIRTLLILCWPRIEKDYRLRVLTCFAAFVLCCAAGIAANVYNSAPFRVMSWIPFLGIGLGVLVQEPLLRCRSNVGEHEQIWRRAVHGTPAQRARSRISAQDTR